jgi:hydrophobe/amphiphile efflux-1 (HAE1) family protein
MFTHFFVKKPVLASVCSLLIILVGWIGYTRLPIQEYPTIESPTVNVQTIYRGANPLVVETEVTEIIEAEINGIEGVKSLTSSSREEQSSITVEFELNQDLDVAAQDVQNRVSRVIGRLPDDVDPSVVSKSNSGGERIMWIAIYGKNYSNLELSNYADKFIQNALATVDGVSNIFIAGERRYAMRLWLNPKQMAARNITALDIEQALRRQNVEIPSGRIEGKMNEYPIRTLGRLQTPQEYEDLVIRRNEDGSQIRLKEVGYAEIGAESDRTVTRFNGQPAVSLGISKTSGANLLEVAEAVKAKIQELSKNFPEGMAYTIAVDDSDFVQIAIDEVWHSLFLAIAFVILVIFVFLRSWRATLIPALTIPVSLIGAFGIMFILGFSINILTLFALTLSTGLVVDDTIVVLENIVRYIEEKKMKPFPAVLNAVGEVVFAVIATTVVLIAVFIPVGFSGGTTGRLFNEFAITIAAAVVLSSFVALTLAPAVSARVLQPTSASKTHKNIFHKLIEIPLDLFEWALNQVQNFYGQSLNFIMEFKLIVVLGFILSLGLTAWLFIQIPQGFLPTEDRGRVFIPINAPQGVSLAYTDNVLQEVEEILGDVPEMRTYFTIAGFGRGASQVNRGFAFTRLFPWSERTEPEQSQQNIVRKLFGQFAQITDALVFAINPSSLPGSGQGQPIQFVIQGNDLTELAEVAEAFKLEAERLPEVVNLETDLQVNKPELVLAVDRLQAGNLGVSVQEIARTLQIMMGGQRITNFNQGNQQYEVIVQAEDLYRSNPDHIEEIYVQSDSGQMISLSNLVDVSLSTTPPQINHYNRFRSAQLEGSPAPGVSLGEALAALQNLADEILPQNMQTALAGESLEFAEAGQATVFIFSLALAFIFLTLAAQFESYIDPLIILLAVPLSLFGAFGTLWIAQLDLNIYSRIGLIMLIGLATKNSILIVEFANQLQQQGLSISSAAIEAGRVRFRPILMTAFSTIFGVFPLAFATGAGAASRISIGMAVLGGMLVSTLFSLYIVPVFYAIAKTFQLKLLRKSDRSLTQIKSPHESNGQRIKIKSD